MKLVTLPVPKPGTLAGLIMVLSAFGPLAIRKGETLTAKHFLATTSIRE